MGICYGLNVVCPHNPYVEALTPSVMVFTIKSFRRQLGLDAVKRVGPSL